MVIKKCAEFIHKKDIGKIPKRLRGVYTLFKKREDRINNIVYYNVVYIGLATKCIWSRINSHTKSRRKNKHWTHFSLFEVNNNVRNQEIKDLEGIIRHVYRKDRRANKINIAKGYDALRKIRACKTRFENWK